MDEPSAVAPPPVPDAPAADCSPKPAAEVAGGDPAPVNADPLAPAEPTTVAAEMPPASPSTEPAPVPVPAAPTRSGAESAQAAEAIPAPAAPEPSAEKPAAAEHAAAEPVAAGPAAAELAMAETAVAEPAVAEPAAEDASAALSLEEVDASPAGKPKVAAEAPAAADPLDTDPAAPADAPAPGDDAAAVSDTQKPAKPDSPAPVAMEVNATPSPGPASPAADSPDKSAGSAGEGSTATAPLAPTAPRAASVTPASSVHVPSSPNIVADVPAPAVIFGAAQMSRDVTPQPVPGSVTPLSVSTAAPSPSPPPMAAVGHGQTEMLHAPTWDILQKVAEQSRMSWSHPAGSRQVETDVLHLCRAITRLPELNLTQSFISQRSGVSQGTLSHYVRGLHQGNQRSVEERLSSFLRRFCNGEFDTMIPVPGADRPKPIPVVIRPPPSRPTSAAAASHAAAAAATAAAEASAAAAAANLKMTNAIYHQTYPAQSVAQHQQMMENMAAAAFGRASESVASHPKPVPLPNPIQQQLALQQQQQAAAQQAAVQQAAVQQQQQLHLQAQVQRQAQEQHQQQQHQQQVLERVKANAAPALQASAQQGMLMKPASAALPVPPGCGVYDAPQGASQSFKRPRPMYGAPLPDHTSAISPRDAVDKAFHTSKAVSWKSVRGTSEPLLLPVEVFVDLNGRVLHTFTQWDVNERVKSPEMVATSMRQERGLPAEFDAAIAAVIRGRLFDAGIIPPPPPPADDENGDGGDENLRFIKIVLELNDDDGRTQILRDSFEWDIGVGGGDVWNSPETFSQTLCADAGISQKHAASVSRAIRQELSRAHAIAYGDEGTRKKAMAQVGLSSAIAKKLPPVETALKELSGDEVRAQRREESEIMVSNMFVKPLLTEVEIESERRTANRKLEAEMEAKRRLEQSELARAAEAAAARNVALQEAERERAEAERLAKEEDGIDIRPYTSLKLGYNSHPSVWIQGVVERKEANEPMFPAAGLAEAALADAAPAEKAFIPKIRLKMNGVSHAVKRERDDGSDERSDVERKHFAGESDDGTVMRLPLHEEAAPVNGEPVVMRLPLSDTPVSPR